MRLKLGVHGVASSWLVLSLIGSLMAHAQGNRADKLALSKWVAIVERDQAEYEQQLENYSRSLSDSEKALKEAVTALSEKKTSLAIAEKQALREGASDDDERSTKRLALAVKFAEGEVDLQQRRVLRITRKLDEATKGVQLNKEAKQALLVLTQDDLLP